MALLRILLGSDTISFLTRILLLAPVYAAALAVYRLYFHPLAKFPGPKLAAATGWYETYDELWHGEGGQYIFMIEEWHKKYGKYSHTPPVVDSECNVVFLSVRPDLTGYSGRVTH